MPHVYVLKSLKDNMFYIGSTNDLDKRLKDHNSGKNRSTKHRRPFVLVYHENYDNITEAENREKLFKKSHGVLYRAAGWNDNHK